MRVTLRRNEPTDIAVQLRGGALPLPVEVVENRTVGATLGRDSIQSSIYAGIGGLVFGAGLYGHLLSACPDLIADVALLIYAVLTYAAFNLLGVTLDPSWYRWFYSQHWDGSGCQCADF